MAFTPIETQEQFNEAISERIEQAKRSARKEFEGWVSPEAMQKQTEELSTQLTGLNDQIKVLTDEKTALETQLTEKDGTIAKYERDSVKTKIAREYGLSYEAIGFIQGEDEEAIRKSAETLKGLVESNQKPVPAPPLGNPENPPAEDGVLAAFRKLNPNIKL